MEKEAPPVPTRTGRSRSHNASLSNWLARTLAWVRGFGDGLALHRVAQELPQPKPPAGSQGTFA